MLLIVVGSSSRRGGLHTGAAALTCALRARYLPLAVVLPDVLMNKNKIMVGVYYDVEIMRFHVWVHCPAQLCHVGYG